MAACLPEHVWWTGAGTFPAAMSLCAALVTEPPASTTGTCPRMRASHTSPRHNDARTGGDTAANVAAALRRGGLEKLDGRRRAVKPHPASLTAEHEPEAQPSDHAGVAI